MHSARASLGFSLASLVKLATVGSLASLGLAACSATSTTGSGNQGQGGTAHGGNHAGGAGADNLGGSLFGGGGSGGDCAIHCSSDLHQVLDCNDNVVKECTGDTGCAPGGECVAPCEAAQLNGSSVGCDFYSVIPGPEYEVRGSCFAVLLANTWTSPVTVGAERGGQPLPAGILYEPVGTGGNLTYQPLPNGQLDPGKVGILFLSQWPSGDGYFVPCPPGTVAGVNQDVAVDKTGIGDAFHVTTTAPVVAYDIFPYGGASSFVSSATLLVPTPTWGQNFVAADAFEANPSLEFVNGNPFIQIVASQDATTVTILPKVAINGGPGVGAAAAGVPVDYVLNKGQYLQVLQPGRLIGSPIASDKPVSVWGGTACMNVPVGSVACDSGHQQLLPVNAMGSEYVAVLHRDRNAGFAETGFYTMVGAVDGTTLFYDPSPPPGAPIALNNGDVFLIQSTYPFQVQSQDADHPFYLAAHMTGASHAGGEQGDPEYVNIIPSKQYLDEYLFLTDPTYLNTHLVFTRGKASDGTYKDVSLDCAGALTGWQAVGSGTYEYLQLDLVRDGVGQGGCNNGVHVASSEGPFGLTVWGWSPYASYAYPAGMSVKPINTVVVPPTPN